MKFDCKEKCKYADKDGACHLECVDKLKGQFSAKQFTKMRNKFDKVAKKYEEG